MLISQKEILKTLGLSDGVLIAEDMLEVSLRSLYYNFPISLESIINTLADYALIKESTRKNFSGRKNALRRKDLITSWHLPADPEEILETVELLNRFEMDDEGYLSRPMGLSPDIHIAKDFDAELPTELLREFGL